MPLPIEPSLEALIAHQKLVIEKLRRELYGSRSERGRKLLDQMELELEEMEASARQDELAAERAAKAAGTDLRSGAHPQPSGAQAVSGTSAARAGDRAGTDRVPVLRLGQARQDRRGHHRDAGGDPAPVEGDPARPREVHLPGLREDQPAAGAVPCRSRAAVPARTFWPWCCTTSSRLHQPLNRQSEAYAREGIDLSLSTLADDVGDPAPPFCRRWRD